MAAHTVVKFDLSLASIVKDTVLRGYFYKKENEFIKYFDISQCNMPPQTLIANVQNALEEESHHFVKDNIYLFLPLVYNRRETCDMCLNQLLVKSIINCTLYDDIFGTKLIHVIVKKCNRCKINFFPGYTMIFNSNCKNYDDDWMTYPVFLSTRETAFSFQFLKHTVSLIFKSVLPFDGEFFFSIIITFYGHISSLCSHIF